MECNKQKTKVPKPNQNSQSEQSKYDKTTIEKIALGRSKENFLKKVSKLRLSIFQNYTLQEQWTHHREFFVNHIAILKVMHSIWAQNDLTLLHSLSYFQVLLKYNHVDKWRVYTCSCGSPSARLHIIIQPQWSYCSLDKNVLQPQNARNEGDLISLRAELLP